MEQHVLPSSPLVGVELAAPSRERAARRARRNTLNRPTQHVETSSVEHSVFKLGGVHCLGCATAVERALQAQPYVADVRLDWNADVVHVGYDPAKIRREDIERVIADTGCECEPVGVRDELPKRLPPQKRRWQHLGHGVDAQPVSMGTKHDRMQYEMPATQVDHDAHADMGHDMSDPGMAAAMERDMRNKF